MPLSGYHRHANDWESLKPNYRHRSEDCQLNCLKLQKYNLLAIGLLRFRLSLLVGPHPSDAYALPNGRRRINGRLDRSFLPVEEPRGSSLSFVPVQGRRTLDSAPGLILSVRVARLRCISLQLVQRRGSVAMG